jgi:hypothetical protein
MKSVGGRMKGGRLEIEGGTEEPGMTVEISKGERWKLQGN